MANVFYALLLGSLALEAAAMPSYDKPHQCTQPEADAARKIIDELRSDGRLDPQMKIIECIAYGTGESGLTASVTLEDADRPPRTPRHFHIQVVQIEDGKYKRTLVPR